MHSMKTLKLDSSYRPLEVIDAVEALVHADRLEPVAENISRSLKLGGELVICDDFLAFPYDQLGEREQEMIDCLRKGWEIPSLSTWDSFNGILKTHGLELVETEEWTPFLKLDRWRDKMLSILMRVGGDLPIHSTLWGSWKAGNVLRQTSLDGLTQYRFGIWKKVR